MYLRGWVEYRGHRLSETELGALLSNDPQVITRCGGEFFLEWNGCRARDHFGIMRGAIPPGTMDCGEGSTVPVIPDIETVDLTTAITTATRLRSEGAIIALSGGIDSALIASLARQPAIAVGVDGSHDLRRATAVASHLCLPLDVVKVTGREVEEALPSVLGAIPRVTPTDAAIAATLFFVARGAARQGYECILTGQGADELFAGYARYLSTTHLEEDLERDFQGLSLQLVRDQAVASLHGTWFSLPYLDLRVVRAAQVIPASEKVAGGVRKVPLREVGLQFLSPEIVWYEKKAMQYGSGIWGIIRNLARRNGYKNAVQGYLDHLMETWS
ncbi:MAG: asparagine synthase C-terminal domain-containing protein [Methanomicrobiales archaeon]|nr:asparagine synthase C-terminal domain-containing protein [Methanomicrobiales archaeon]